MVTPLSLYIRQDSRFRCPSSVTGVYVLSTGQYVPTDALDAAAASQRALQATDWGDLGSVLVRMAVHTGEAEERERR